MSSSTVFDQLRNFGFHLADEYIAQETAASGEHLTNFNAFKQLLLKSDLRKQPCLRPYFPPEMPGSAMATTLSGPIVLQITGIVNVAVASKRKFEDTSDRILSITLTDGHTKVTGIEMERLSDLKANSPPGGKLLYLGGAVVRGKLLLSPSNCRYLGGEVSHLLEAHLANINAMKFRDMTSNLQKSKMSKVSNGVGMPPKFELKLMTEEAPVKANVGKQASKDTEKTSDHKEKKDSDHSKGKEKGGKSGSNNKAPEQLISATPPAPVQHNGKGEKEQGKERAPDHKDQGGRGRGDRGGRGRGESGNHRHEKMEVLPAPAPVPTAAVSTPRGPSVVQGSETGRGGRGGRGGRDNHRDRDPQPTPQQLPVPPPPAHQENRGGRSAGRSGERDLGSGRGGRGGRGESRENRHEDAISSALDKISLAIPPSSDDASGNGPNSGNKRLDRGHARNLINASLGIKPTQVNSVPTQVPAPLPVFTPPAPAPVVQPPPAPAPSSGPVFEKRHKPGEERDDDDDHHGRGRGGRGRGRGGDGGGGRRGRRDRSERDSYMAKPGENTLDLSAMIPIATSSRRSGGGSGAGGTGGMWSCSKCTYSNHGDLKSCEMCGTKR